MLTLAQEAGLRVLALAESALLIELEQRVDSAVNAAARQLAQRIRMARLPGVEEVLPAYASVLLRFQPRAWQSQTDGPHAALWRAISALPAATGKTEGKTTLHRIPVCYGGCCGADLEDVARHCGLGVAELIARHTAVEYQVAMLGFAPGFTYLLGLDPALHMPRRATPRVRVPAGSVGIGGAQTGIYPAELPGGWQLLGRTPLPLFDAANEDRPTLLRPGDRVRFEPVSADVFDQLAAEQADA